MTLNKSSVLTKLPVVALLAFISCFLWGSAAPAIKTGYALLNIDASDTPTILLFAGMRFTMSGIMVLAAASVISKKPMLPQRDSAKKVLILAMFQTVLQYLFFYVGVAHASGVKSSIMVSTNVFLSMLVSAWLFHQEKLSSRKIIGCLIGFAGVVYINLAGNSVDMKFTFLGEGFVVISELCYAMSSSLIRRYSQTDDPVVLSGSQFFVGGVMLMLIGICFGGRIAAWTAKGVTVLVYLAFVSAMAYTLWSILLAHNPVSRVSIFGFLNPLCGVVISAVVLHEEEQAFNLTGLISLALVCIGIYVVNSKSKKKASVPE